MNEIKIVAYKDAKEIKHITDLIQKELSEPYTIYTYRYFVFQWPNLTFFAKIDESYVGVLVAKLETHKKKHNTGLTEMLEAVTLQEKRGYIAMLSVDVNFRNRGIGRMLIEATLNKFKELEADEVVLETECSNTPAIKLYTSLGFFIDKRLEHYYYNRSHAYRLKYFF